MKTVHIPASRQYDVLIERGLLQSAGAQIRGVTKASAILIVSDDAVWPLFGETVQRSLEASARLFSPMARVPRTPRHICSFWTRLPRSG